MRQVLFGTDEPAAEALELRAERLTARLRGTRLGPIAVNGHEVWHGVDFLYRDPDWGTPQPSVDEVEQEPCAHGFNVALRGRIGAAISFEIAIRGEPDRLRYDVTAAVLTDVLANRAGLVVMHPLSVCGRAVHVEHTDGRTSVSTFPIMVAPWPPFTLVRAVRHEYTQGAWAGCRFAGDDFELEDQRNNADASFKTYSRSNLMPRPYSLRAGMVLRQSVDLRIESGSAMPRSSTHEPVNISVDNGASTWPSVGTAIAAADLAHVQAIGDVVAALAPAHIHLELERPDDEFDAASVARVLAAAGGCALRLQIGGASAEAGPLRRIASALEGAGVRPSTVAVFPSTPPVVAAARRAFPLARIGGGTPHFFTQLNRIEDLAPVDFLAFTTSNVVHGVDDEEIMVGLQSLPAMVETLRWRHGNLPVQVGPSSIGARCSPLGGQPASDGTRRLALARRDPRTRGLYGAAWAVGYVAQFGRAGVESISLFDLLGDATLVDADGATTPAFEVLRRLGAPASRRAVTTPLGAPVAAVALERRMGCEIILANLSAEPLTVTLQAANFPAPVQLMDAHSLAYRKKDPAAPAWRLIHSPAGALELPPYAVAFV
ncbi:MAG: hypothetical protein NVS3B2_08690 [Ramlibacter sp.]